MQVLRQSANAALAAPSIFNTQPWRWQITDTVMRLWADRDRQLLVADPEGRLLTVSCGVALHHARVALAAAGRLADVHRLPDPGDPDLLAEIRVAGPYQPQDSEVGLRQAISLRRTDRRAFFKGVVPAEAAAKLVDAAQSQHAHLHLVRRNEVSALALAAARAGALQLADFVPFGERGMPAGPHTDTSAQYAVIFTDEDTPLAWLRAGEALSAVLLTATSLGLATAPISDVTELAVTREQLRGLLAGIGVPQLAVRIGHAPPGSPPPASPRRREDEVIYP